MAMIEIMLAILIQLHEFSSLPPLALPLLKKAQVYFICTS